MLLHEFGDDEEFANAAGGRTLHAVLVDGAPVEHCADASQRNAQLDGCSDPVAEEVDEGVHPVRGDGTDAVGEVGSVLDRRGPDLPQVVGVARCRGSDHPGTPAHGELHDEAADTAGRRGDDDGVASPDGGVLECVEGRRSGDVEAAGGLPRHAARLDGELRDRHGDVGGVRTARHEAHDLVSDGELGDTRSDPSHDAGQVPALPFGEDDGPALWSRSGPDGALDGIGAGGDDLHEHLTDARDRHLDVDDLENLRSAEL
ncbi:hypothetical protein ASF30_03475 [Leifsonia sp. Leaf264]|nr:hypothetical protein ASF30_03475 [Leifsonia sp. Leaf264]